MHKNINYSTMHNNMIQVLPLNPTNPLDHVSVRNISNTIPLLPPGCAQRNEVEQSTLRMPDISGLQLSLDHHAHHNPWRRGLHTHPAVLRQ